jgi:hypothetical protein
MPGQRLGQERKTTMLVASGQYVSGVITGLDSVYEFSDGAGGEQVSIMLIFCEVHGIVSGAVPMTRRMTDIQKVGFATVGAVLRDAGDFLL